MEGLNLDFWFILIFIPLYIMTTFNQNYYLKKRVKFVNFFICIYISIHLSFRLFEFILTHPFFSLCYRFGQLQDVNLENIEPAIRADMENEPSHMREDSPKTFENREAILAAIPSYKEPYIEVPKVLNID